MNAEDLEALLSPAGRELLDSMPPYVPDQVFSLTTALRSRGHDPALVSAALTQKALRHKAIDKFGADAASMFFTPDGLEQATRPRIAAAHAERFQAAGVREVWDLGCGIGSDAIALARSGLTVRAVDLDPTTVAIARANVGSLLAPGAAVTVDRADAMALDLPTDVGVWLDPARRTSGVADIRGRTRRTFRLEEMQPSWQFITALGASGGAVGAKLSPSFPHSALPADASAQWVSYGGEVLECAVWFGPLADAEPFSARVMTASDEVVVVPAPEREPVAAPLDLRRFLYEADRAVVRAGATSALAEAVDGRELSPGLGHVTTDAEVAVPYARRYRIEHAMPFQPKALRAWLRARGVARVTVKKRGVKFDDVRLRRDLKLCRDGDEAILLVTRSAGAEIVLVLGDCAPSP